MLTLNDEDTLSILGALQKIVLDTCFTRLLASERDVRLLVVLDFIGHDLGRRPLNDKDALVLVQ